MVVFHDDFVIYHGGFIMSMVIFQTCPPLNGSLFFMVMNHPMGSEKIPKKITNNKTIPSLSIRKDP